MSDIQIVDFAPAHVTQIRVQPRQKEIIGELTEDYGVVLARDGLAMSAMCDGEVLFCGGMVKVWEGRWSMWAILSEHSGRHMTRMTRIAQRMLELHSGKGRLEAMVRSDFKQAHRWVTLLGFNYHHHEEQFLPDGSDADIYVRRV